MSLTTDDESTTVIPIDKREENAKLAKSVEDKHSTNENSDIEIAQGSVEIQETEVIQAKETITITETERPEEEEETVETVEQEDDRGAYEEQAYVPRESHVETIVESDEEIDYTFTEQARDKLDRARDNLIYRFGCTKVLVPVAKKINIEGEERTTYEHELRDVVSLANKFILLYVCSNHEIKHRTKENELRSRVKKFVLQHTDFSAGDDFEKGDGSTRNEFAVVYVSRDQTKEDFDEFLKDLPFYAFPYEDETTRKTMSALLADSLLTTASSKIVVFTPDHELITDWGKSCFLYNPDHCALAWKSNLPGISFSQAFFSRFFP